MSFFKPPVLSLHTTKTLVPDADTWVSIESPVLLLRLISESNEKLTALAGNIDDNKSTAIEIPKIL